jgi:6-pyruvoyltetrahydropterin/6-carboxytetrahydropterin synthase
LENLLVPVLEVLMSQVERFGILVDKQYFNFNSAHFLIFADGTREELHGHNYHLGIELEGNLGEGSLVVDFIPFKPMVKSICDSLDHKLLLPRDNPMLEVEHEGNSVVACFGDDRFCFPARDVTILPIPNTSTECLARYISGRIDGLLSERFPDARVHRMKVSVSESPGQSGWYQIDRGHSAG